MINRETIYGCILSTIISMYSYIHILIHSCINSVDEATRTKRKKALLIIGEVFMMLGGSTEDGIADIKSRLGAQMNGGGKHEPKDGI
jgi:hypothetical protein